MFLGVMPLALAGYPPYLFSGRITGNLPDKPTLENFHMNELISEYQYLLGSQPSGSQVNWLSWRLAILDISLLTATIALGYLHRMHAIRNSVKQVKSVIEMPTSDLHKVKSQLELEKHKRDQARSTIARKAVVEQDLSDARFRAAFDSSAIRAARSGKMTLSPEAAQALVHATQQSAEGNILGMVFLLSF
jgi:hypothetical protein